MFNPFGKRPPSVTNVIPPAQSASNLAGKTLRVVVTNGTSNNTDLEFYSKGFDVENEALVVAILSAAAADYEYDVIKSSEIVSDVEINPVTLDITVYPISSDNDEQFVSYTNPAGEEVEDFETVLNVVELALNSYGYDLVA